MVTKKEFINLLDKYQLDGLGAEIGVGDGRNSEFILNNSNLHLLFSIDNWQAYETEFIGKISLEEQFRKYNKTRKRLEKFGHKSIICRMTSKEANYFFDDNKLDFVYIDADHKYKEVSRDLRLWYPKVKQDGIFAGHDYREDFGVKKAVDEFFNEVNVVNLEFPIWWIRKGKGK